MKIFTSLGFNQPPCFSSQPSFVPSSLVPWEYGFFPLLPLKAAFWGTGFLMVSVGWVCYQEHKQVFVDFLDKSSYAVGKLNLFLFLKSVGTTVIAVFYCPLSSLAQGNTVTPFNLCRIYCESCFHEALDECFHYLRRILWVFFFFLIFSFPPENPDV